MVARGATGLNGSGSTKIGVAVEMHPEIVFFVVRLKVVFGDNPAKVRLTWYVVPPSMLY